MSDEQPVITLTPMQRAVFDTFREFCRDHGYSPTYEEIGALLDRSTTSIYEHVDALIEKGLLKRGDPNQSRNIELVGREMVVLEEALEAVGQALAGNDEETLGRVLNALNSLKRH